MDLFHDHVYHIVTLAEMMMEGKDHAVLDAAFYEGIMDVLDKLASCRIVQCTDGRSRLCIFVVIVGIDALERLLACCF